MTDTSYLYEENSICENTVNLRRPLFETCFEQSSFVSISNY